MIFKSSFTLNSSNLTAMISLDNYLQSFLDTIKEMIPGWKQPFGYYYATCKFYVAMNFINFSLAMMQSIAFFKPGVSMLLIIWHLQ